jgi:hypothetical protein
MSKRRRRAERLPLESANWIPATEAYRLLTGLRGDPDLAAKDLTAAVAAKHPDKRLPCMQRAIASHIAPDQDREIVPLSFWDDHVFGFDPVSEKLQIWAKGLAVEFRLRVAFFVWRPALAKLWPALAPSPAPGNRADDRPRRRKPGKPPEHEWPTFVARELIQRALAGKKMPTAPEMLRRCQEVFGWEPDVRQMQKLLKDLLS